MSNKYDEPPAYTGPTHPPAAHYAGANDSYYNQGGPPGAGGYYQPNPQMGYGPQGGHNQGQQQGYGPGPYGPPQGGYYQQQGGYYRDNRSGPGCLEGLLAALACCCCLDCLLF